MCFWWFWRWYKRRSRLWLVDLSPMTRLYLQLHPENSFLFCLLKIEYKKAKTIHFQNLLSTTVSSKEQLSALQWCINPAKIIQKQLLEMVERWRKHVTIASFFLFFSDNQTLGFYVAPHKAAAGTNCSPWGHVSLATRDKCTYLETSSRAHILCLFLTMCVTPAAPD